jgi:hypothetical protein
MSKRYAVEEVGFGGSIQQVSLYENGRGTQIIAQCTGDGYDQNRANALALCATLNGSHRDDCYRLAEGGPCSCRLI